MLKKNKPSISQEWVDIFLEFRKERTIYMKKKQTISTVNRKFEIENIPGIKIPVCIPGYKTSTKGQERVIEISQIIFRLILTHKI